MEVESVVTLGPSTGASGSGSEPAVQKMAGTLPVQKDQGERNLSGGNAEQARQRVLGRKDFWLAVAVFILVGLNSLMAWNVMLNLAPYMAASYFDGKDWGNTFLACFQGACVIVQITSIYFKFKPRALTFYVATTVNAVAFLAVTPASAYCSKTAAVVLVHLICLTWGGASGALQGAGFAYAGTLPVNFAVFVSAGQGIAGLAAFALNTLLGFVFFDLNTYGGLTNQAWVLYAICSASSALLAVGIFFLAARPWARQALQADAKGEYVTRSSSQVAVSVEVGRDGSRLVGQPAHLKEDMNSKDTAATMLPMAYSNEPSKEQALGRTTASRSSKDLSLAQTCGKNSSPSEVGSVDKTAAKDFLAETQELRADVAEQQADGAQLPARSLLTVARVMWQPLLALFATFFVSLNLFPRIGPVGWNYNQNVPNHFVILFGLFAVADTLGRSTPSLQLVSSRWLGWTLLPERIFLWLVFSRVVFYIPFFLSYKLENSVVLNDFWWLSCLMLLFAFTHGWFTSLGFVYAVAKVRESEKGIAASLAVVALSVGILVGLYIALAY